MTKSESKPEASALAAMPASRSKSRSGAVSGTSNLGIWRPRRIGALIAADDTRWCGDNDGVHTFVALLRGINVGGRAKVPMAELKELLAGLGLEDVATYIQSGNVVFRSPAVDAKELAARIEQQIQSAFGLSVAVLLRTPGELARIAEGNPFLGDGADPSRLHVVFMDVAPNDSAVAGLDPDRSEPDEFRVQGARDLPPAPERRGSLQADDRLLRAPARRPRDRAQLEHAEQARRARRRRGSTARLTDPGALSLPGVLRTESAIPCRTW